MRIPNFLFPGGAPLTGDFIPRIIGNHELLSRKSFKVVEEDGTYQVQGPEFEDIFKETSRILQAMSERKTIIVRNMELFSPQIRAAALMLGADTDVHMYLTPDGGNSFAKHKDDRNVITYMLFGEKKFYRFVDENDWYGYNMKEGECLYLPRDQYHQAVPEGASCLLSFGFTQDHFDASYTYELDTDIPQWYYSKA